LANKSINISWVIPNTCYPWVIEIYKKFVKQSNKVMCWFAVFLCCVLILEQFGSSISSQCLVWFIKSCARLYSVLLSSVSLCGYIVMFVISLYRASWGVYHGWWQSGESRLVEINTQPLSVTSILTSIPQPHRF
jgi:hypothetical protein